MRGEIFVWNWRRSLPSFFSSLPLFFSSLLSPLLSYSLSPSSFIPPFPQVPLRLFNLVSVLNTSRFYSSPLLLLLSTKGLLNPSLSPNFKQGKELALAFGITTMASRLGSVINFLGSASLEEVYFFISLFLYLLFLFFLIQ